MLSFDEMGGLAVFRTFSGCVKLFLYIIIYIPIHADRRASNWCPRLMLNIFSDRRFLPDGVEHAMPLFPFWGEPKDYDAYTRFAAWARDNWRLTALEDAQIAALPFDGGEIVGRTREASTIDLAQRFVDLAAGAGLWTLVVVNHDVIRPAAGIRADGRAADVARPPHPRALGVRASRLARKHRRHSPWRAPPTPRVPVKARREFLRNCGTHRPAVQAPREVRGHAGAEEARALLAAQRWDLSAKAGDVAPERVATGRDELHCTRRLFRRESRREEPSPHGVHP